MAIVLANGCFDCLHIGHVAHLEEAAKLGSLIVALTVDRCVGKGQGRPVFCWEERARMLFALRCVTDVFPSESGLSAIAEVRPDIFVKGPDWNKRLVAEAALVQSMGGEVVIINAFPTYSSTQILTGRLLHERISANRIGRV